jgi:hypothetical protein
MLFPLLGRQIATALETGRRYTRAWLIATGASMGVLLAGVIALAYVPWPPISLLQRVAVENPILTAIDWNSLEAELKARQLLGRPNLFVVATRWEDAGKIDYALHGKMPVLCLARDPHGYGMSARSEAHIGDDALIIGRDLRPDGIDKIYGRYFESTEELPPIPILHAGQTEFELKVYLAHSLHPVPLWSDIFNLMGPRQG